MSRKSWLSLIAVGVLMAGVAEPAFAQRGDRGGDRGHRGGDRGRDHDRGGRRDNDRDWSRGDHHRGDRRGDRHYDRRDDWRLSFNFVTPYSGGYYAPSYDYYRYRAPVYYNDWGLAPHDCRVDVEFDYWYGRPADVEIRRCADRYGNVYIVLGSQRLWRYR
jgi:hypothetical protein